MMLKTTTSLAFAAACLTAIATMPAHAQMSGPYGSTPGYNGSQGYPGSTSPNYGPGNYTPQPNQGDTSSSVSARQNVSQSQQYDRTLETNRRFRQARMHKECGPISDPQLHQSCIASFSQDEPTKGSSSSRRTHRS
jgi:hypothetical protein